MQTGATLDWQVFEEGEWDEAIAAGLIATLQTGDTSSMVAKSVWGEWQSRLAGVVAVVLVGLLLGLAYPSWRAAGMEVSALPAENPALVAETFVLQGDAPLRPVAEEALGARLTMVTHHFRFEVYQRDSAIVGEVAANLDARYRELRHTLGLAAPTGSLRIAVAPYPIATGWRQADDHLIIASPRDLPVPARSSAVAVMTALLLQPLTQLALAEALETAPVRWQWNLVVDGLRLWLRHCPVAASHTPCPGHQPTVQQVEGAMPSYRLADLLFADADWFYPAQQASRIEASATLIAYITHTYGDASLPDLLHAFAQHNSWQTLIPEVFATSVEDFERGWQESLNHLPAAGG